MENESHIKRELFDFALGLGMLYLSFHPEKIDQVKSFCQRKWDTFRHTYSVREAVQAIRKLPETETTITTEKMGSDSA